MSVASVLLDPAYRRLKNLVLEQTGLHYYAEKDEDLATRLARRITARGSVSCAEYISLLENDHTRGGEWDALLGEITIGETYFFRQIEHFDLLRDTIIPEILVRKKHVKRLRIWSAGCATGAETYSISLLLRLNFRYELADWDVSILGTDINVDFLAQARTGRFAAWALREIPESIRSCCFRNEDRVWVLSPEHLEHVRFEYHNLASEAPYPNAGGEAFDIIFCRNVMIYFSRERIRSVSQRFFDSLTPGGWLLVGHAEPNMVDFPQYEVITNATTTAYRKRMNGPLHLQMDARMDWQPPEAMPVYTPWVFTDEPVAVAPGRTPRLPQISESKPTARLAKARVHADEGDWPSALAICRSLIEENPLDPGAHFTLGLVQMQTAALAEAEASLRRAIYLDRGFALAHYHLGLLLQTSGKPLPAKKAFANVSDLLRSAPADEVLPHGDGINAAELRELAGMHLEAMKTR